MTRSRYILAPRKPWTADEDETLRINWANWPCALIAAALKRSPAVVYKRVRILGLEKSPDFLREQGRIGAMHPKAIATRIRPRNVPPNKGQRHPGWSVGRMGQTQFKPGVKPHTWVPIGTVAVHSAGGYLKRKVRDDAAPGMGRRNWEFVHVLLWTEHHGPVPRGHCLAFRNGDKADIRVENLELITRRERMSRNTIHNYPEDIKGAIRALGSLRKRIHRQEKQHEEQDRGSA